MYFNVVRIIIVVWVIVYVGWFWDFFVSFIGMMVIDLVGYVSIVILYWNIISSYYYVSSFYEVVLVVVD